MSLPDKCMKCGAIRPRTGGKFCPLCVPGGKVAKMEGALAERNSAITRLGDRIHELETLLNERNAELAEAVRVARMLVESDRNMRGQLSLKDQEIERLRGERGLHG